MIAIPELGDTEIIQFEGGKFTFKFIEKIDGIINFGSLAVNLISNF